MNNHEPRLGGLERTAVGLLVLPVPVTALVGLVMLWASRVWSWREKLVGTLIPLAYLCILLDLISSNRSLVVVAVAAIIVVAAIGALVRPEHR